VTSLPSLADQYFRLERREVSDHDVVIAAGFSVLVILEGGLRIDTAGRTCATAPGETFVVPAAAGPVTVSGRGALLVIRPPAA
jgi:mannose-6-phosphate isomerase class I